GGGRLASLSRGRGLSPARTRGGPLPPRQLCRVVRAAAQAAGINKRVSPHTLRHSFATHLLEQGVDIRVIQTLLGHAKLDTTALYTRVANATIRAVTSPLDRLAPLIEERPRAAGRRAGARRARVGGGAVCLSARGGRRGPGPGGGGGAGVVRGFGGRAGRPPGPLGGGGAGGGGFAPPPFPPTPPPTTAI